MTYNYSLLQLVSPLKAFKEKCDTLHQSRSEHGDDNESLESLQEALAEALLMFEFESTLEKDKPVGGATPSPAQAEGLGPEPATTDRQEVPFPQQVLVPKPKPFANAPKIAKGVVRPVRKPAPEMKGSFSL